MEYNDFLIIRLHFPRAFFLQRFRRQPSLEIHENSFLQGQETFTKGNTCRLQLFLTCIIILPET